MDAWAWRSTRLGMFAGLLALPVASALIAAVAAGPGPPLFLRVRPGSCQEAR